MFNPIKHVAATLLAGSLIGLPIALAGAPAHAATPHQWWLLKTDTGTREGACTLLPDPDAPYTQLGRLKQRGKDARLYPLPDGHDGAAAWVLRPPLDQPTTFQVMFFDRKDTCERVLAMKGYRVIPNK